MNVQESLDDIVRNAKYVFVFSLRDHRRLMKIHSAVRTNYNYYRPFARFTTEEHHVLLIHKHLRHLEEAVKNQFPEVDVTHEDGRVVFTFP